MIEKLILEKLDNTQTKDRIASLLRHEILSGKIKNGDRLQQEQVAEKLGVSRMPVREAFQTLELEGLLQRLPNRHIQVIGVSENIISENFQFIAAIETEIIMMLLKKDHNFFARECRSDEQFHTGLADKIDNLYIAQMYKRLLNGYPQYVWKNFSNTNQQLNKGIVLEIMNSADRANIYQWIQNYYQSLADTLVDHLKNSNANEKPATY